MHGSSALALIALALLVLYPAWLFVYRLFFHPLAKFPGPKLAAATTWYEIWYDVVKPGMYIYEIEKMHEKYGPIVRITPNELSIHDPEYYDELYVGASVRKTDKHGEFCQGTGMDGSALLTLTHDLHRRRRKVLDPYFSRPAVRKMETIIHRLLNRFEERVLSGKNKIVRLDHAFVSLSGDVIRSVTCDGIGTELEYLMDDDEFSYWWFEIFRWVVRSAPLFTAFPWIIRVCWHVPESWLLWAFPRGRAFVQFRDLARGCIERAKAEKVASGDDGIPSMKPKIGLPSDAKNDDNFTTVFRHLVQRADIPPSELDTDRLTKEAQALFGAATVATASTLDIMVYHLLSSPEMRVTLTKDLSSLPSLANYSYPATVPTVAELERLPYLSAVINEGLRVGYGSMHRMPRVSPDEELTYKQWVIPRGTPVGMCAYLNHTDPRIFPDPMAFRPDRWLSDSGSDQTRSDDARIKAMKKALIPFTRGSRVCLGQHFAMAELYLFIAVLFRPGGMAASPDAKSSIASENLTVKGASTITRPTMELFETNESDVKHVHDFMIPLPKLDSRGLRVVVK